ncbi:MAG: hypothetical protein MJ053_07295 [Elusimicrobiaceae bacterium]|nr:hypothetical protein [Elusimicrobiaceae bacterium]
MTKQILAFSLAILLCACAGGQIKRSSVDMHAYKKVDFFAAGYSRAAFKIVGTMNDVALEGVLTVKKIGEQDFEVSVMTAGAYRVLYATVTPQGIAYRQLFPDADTSLVRSRISQFLNLLLLPPGVYQRNRVTKEQLTVFYKGEDGSVRLMYNLPNVYPAAAKTVTMLNTADLFYDEYAPADAEATVQVPHALVYKDGKIELSLTLISLK